MILAKEVLVLIGASDRVGARIAHKFADPRFTVIGLDSRPPKVSTTNFEFIKCDVGQERELKQAFEHILQKHGARISSCIQLVREAHVLPHLAPFTAEQYLFMSSLLVHAPCEPGQRISEIWPLGPVWDSAKKDLETEELLRARRQNMPLVILRPSCLYDDMCHSTLLAEQIQRIYERQVWALFYPGDLTHGFARLHIDDLADAVWLTVQRRYGFQHELTLIVSEQETVSYDELQKVLGLLCYGEECKTWAIPKWVAKFVRGLEEAFAPHVDSNYWCDTSRIQDKLGWVPKHAFRKSLPKMIDFLKENPLGWYRENGLKMPEKK